MASSKSALKDLSVGLGLLLALALAVPHVTWAGGELKQYVEKPDSSYKYEVLDSANAEGVTVHTLLLTSQTWRDIPWKHQLSIVVPAQPKDTKHALLFVTGGHVNKDGSPAMSKDKDGELQLIGKIATMTGSPVAILRQVPNQPLFEGKSEDTLIAYTYDQFLKSGEADWPLLEPMTKSAVKAMDAVQDFCKTKANIQVDHFVVSGGSKRGWTTWLTGATDKRVDAIAPMVIDTLRFDKQMPYQIESWGKYSEQIEDYTRLGLQAKMSGEEGKKLNSIVDPYSYKDVLTMPKMLVMGTNDPYWVVDAVKFYWDDLSGEKSIHYVPNVGHDLGGGKEAVENLAAFFATVAAGKKHPALDWQATKDGDSVKLHVTANVDAVGGRIWTTAQADRDFRDAKWESKSVDSDNPREATVTIPLPKEGYSGVYLEAIFSSPVGGRCSKCTRVFLLDSKGLL
jgi:PhoPQ-activated pathogenicity-related protein